MAAHPDNPGPRDRAPASGRGRAGREQQGKEDERPEDRRGPDPTRDPCRQLRGVLLTGELEAPEDMDSEDEKPQRERGHAEDPAHRVARLPGRHDRPDHAEGGQRSELQRMPRGRRLPGHWGGSRCSRTPGPRSRARGGRPPASTVSPHAAHATAAARPLGGAVSKSSVIQHRVILAAHDRTGASGMRYETVTTATIVAPWRSRSRCSAPRGSNGRASGWPSTRARRWRCWLIWRSPTAPGRARRSAACCGRPTTRIARGVLCVARSRPCAAAVGEEWIDDRRRQHRPEAGTRLRARRRALPEAAQRMAPLAKA